MEGWVPTVQLIIIGYLPMITFITGGGVRKDPEIIADICTLPFGGMYSYCLWALQFKGAGHEAS